MTQPTAQEIEAKFSILSATQADYLCTTSNLTRAFALQAATQVCHVDTYVDTPAFRLLRLGYALRVRHTDAGYRITLKSLPQQEKSHIHRRVELEGPLDTEANPLTLAHWPTAIRDTITALIGEQPVLQSLCTLRQTRRKRMVTRQQPKSTEIVAPFAELSVDEVKVYPPGEDAQLPARTDHTDHTGAVATFWEAEAELQPGEHEADLKLLTQKLGRVGGLRPNFQSKLEHALDQLSQCMIEGEHVTTHLQATMHMADACRLIWRQQLIKMVLSENGVRTDDDPESVHAMRVAVRRTRVAMQLFQPFFRRKSLRPFRKALRATGRKLGAVRDFDVALAKLTKFQKTIDTPTPERPMPLHEHWQERREVALAELLTWLDSQAYATFLTHFMDFCQTPGKGARHRHQDASHLPEPVAVRHVLPTILLQRFERVQCYETIFVDQATIPAKTLHQLRIECKYVRYVLEFTQHLLGPASTYLIRHLKNLQDQLGDLHDAVVSEKLLDALPPTNADELIHTYRHEQRAVIQHLSGEMRESLFQFITRENRRRLLQALVRL